MFDDVLALSKRREGYASARFVIIVGDTKARPAKYPRHSVRFTGVCTEPLIRPSLVIDDETLEILRS